MALYGVPDEVLTDNGKQFTGRFGKPRPAEVLFERICRENGIRQLLTRPYSPTTIGKVERWHQTRQTDSLNDACPFASVAEAQAAVDAWREEYNQDRPHQSLDMATPASRFRPSPPEADDPLSLWAPADLKPAASPPAEPGDTPTVTERASWPDAVEVDRVVPPSGNMTVGPQQFWLGTTRAGQTVTFWIDTTTVRLSIGGWRVKTVPSRLTEIDLMRLRCARARPAGPRRRGHSLVPWRPAGAWSWTGWSTPPGSSPSAARSSRSAPRWPGSEPGSASTAPSCASWRKNACCGAPCPARSRPASAIASKASAWLASPLTHRRLHRPGSTSRAGHSFAAVESAWVTGLSTVPAVRRGYGPRVLETGTPGSASGLGKRTGSNPGTALVGAAPTLPGASRIRLPLASPSCCDRTSGGRSLTSTRIHSASRRTKDHRQERSLRSRPSDGAARHS